MTPGRLFRPEWFPKWGWRMRWRFRLARLFGRKHIGIDPGGPSGDDTGIVTGYWYRGDFYVTKFEIRKP